MCYIYDYEVKTSFFALFWLFAATVLRVAPGDRRFTRRAYESPTCWLSPGRLRVLVETPEGERATVVGFSNVALASDAPPPDLPVMTEVALYANDVIRAVESGRREGVGLFASRRVAAGTIVLEEEPLAIVSMDPSLFEQHEAELTAAAAYERLLADGQRRWMALHDAFAGRTVDGRVGKSAGGILRSNCYEGSEVREGQANLSYLYEVLSRANHSCEPNTTRFIHPNGSVRLRALRDLAPGEEIFTSYIDGLGSVQRRREALVCKYAFVCYCSRCVRETG